MVEKELEVMHFIEMFCCKEEGNEAVAGSKHD